MITITSRNCSREILEKETKLLRISLVVLVFLFSFLCVSIAALVRFVLFDTLKIVTSIAEYDIFLAPSVEETLKFTFIFAFIFWYLKTIHPTKASVEFIDALLFGASLGIGYGLFEKFVVLLTNVNLINQDVILLKVMPSTFLHFVTSLIHSYNVFSLLALRKNLMWSVVLFFSAIALHMLFNLAWYL